VLAELREGDTQSGRPLARRLDWAADLGLRYLGEGEACDLLLWVGDGGFELRNQRTLRALAKLLRRAGLDVAVLGEAELDSGDLARRLGDEATFQRLAAANVATLRRRSFRRIVTADPHSFHALKNEYPAFGGTFEVLHHTQLLAGLVAEGRLAVPAVASERVITYHDPCYLGRYNGEVEAPRALLDALGLSRVEMERHGLRSFCCGGGGGAAISDVPGARRVPDLRMDQARLTGASVVAVACPTCALMLEGVTGPKPEVADVAELLLEAVERGDVAARKPARPSELVPA
jgi:Fe-S oxidoreductase